MPPEPSPPRYLGVEINRRCNLRCPHCFTASGPEEHPGPPAERVVELLGRFAALGVRHAGFSGGEPLLRTDLEDILAAGLEGGLTGYGLVTNGWAVTPRRARSLREVGVKVVQVSLDGVDAADHDAVRGCGPAGYYRALSAMRCFRDVGIRVDAAVLLNPRNLERLPELALLGEALGLTTLRFCSFVPTGRARDPALAAALAPAPERLDAFFALLRELNRRPTAPLRITIDHGLGPWNDEGSFACSAGQGVAYVSSEGDLYPCPGLIFPAFRVGNVWGDRPLEELLRDPRMHAVRARDRRRDQGPCATCSNAGCSGGCRGLSFALTGDVAESPPYCNVRRVGRPLR
ncbi:MAG: radical SAM protein [Deltaproteobacteria bacterium]|nr:radical SAM protein [Deltaproteobacteria bacterium]